MRVLAHRGEEARSLPLELRWHSCDEMRFARRDQIPHRFRYRDRTMGLLIGVDPDNLTGRERISATLRKDGEFETEAGISDPRHPRADVDFLVEQYRRLVFDDRFDDMEINAGLFGVGILVVTQGAEILGDGRIELGQIMRVEDNALTVDLGISHPKRVKEPELLA